MDKKSAIISGIRGQDASWMADFLLEKGYVVIGFERRISNPDYTNIQQILKHPNFILEYGDVTDLSSLARLLQRYRPTEFYNLSAQSFVKASFDNPIATCDVDFMGVCNCLEAIRLNSPETRFYQASTSEVYGDVIEVPQTETTAARPRSPYAAAKYGAESLIKVYRESYDMFACFARCFNHTGERRGKEFVERKISNYIGEAFNVVERNIQTKIMTTPGFIDTKTAFSIALQDGLIQKLKLGNIDAKRDFTHAKDIVRGMWMMLQAERPDDYVLASGKTYTIRAVLDMAFKVIGIDDWHEFVEYDSTLLRPAEVNLLLGDSSKIRQRLGWEPTITFEQIITNMVKNDILLNRHDT